MSNPFKKSRIALAVFALGLGALTPSLVLAAEAEAKSSATVGQSLTDTAISTKVRAKILADSRIKNSNISVNTTNGTVTLSGSAQTSAMKEAAEDIADHTDGVKDVDNDLTVVVATTVGDKIEKAADQTGHTVKHGATGTGDAISDGYITSKIKSQLLAAKGVSSAGITVETNGGAVTLSGHVPTAAEQRKAVAIAKATKGVKSVSSSNLEVAASS